jgi:hypothetical protein
MCIQTIHKPAMQQHYRTSEIKRALLQTLIDCEDNRKNAIKQKIRTLTLNEKRLYIGNVPQTTMKKPTRI